MHQGERVNIPEIIVKSLGSQGEAFLAWFLGTFLSLSDQAEIQWGQSLHQGERVNLVNLMDTNLAARKALIAPVSDRVG